VVAVHHGEAAEAAGEQPRIVPPCGICRELIYDYGPSATVVLAGEAGPVERPVGDLLPEKETY